MHDSWNDHNGGANNHDGSTDLNDQRTSDHDGSARNYDRRTGDHDGSARNYDRCTSDHDRGTNDCASDDVTDLKCRSAMLRRLS